MDSGLIELRNAKGHLQARLDLNTMKLIIRDRRETTEHDLSRYFCIENARQQTPLQTQDIVLK